MAKHGDTKQRAAMAEREHRRNKRILRLLCFVVAIAVAFVAGFALRSQDQFLVSLGFSIPGVQKAGTQSTDVKKSPYDSISARLSDVEDVLAKSDLNGYDLDEATKEVFKGFSSACDDKYFEYLDPSRYASFVKDSSDGAYNGVGVLFSDYNGRALVSDVFSGSAAEAAGVQQGDVLVGIDGDTSHDWSVTEAISGLSRNAGETVVVTWMRPSSVGAETGTSYTTALTCSSYKEQNVTYSLDGTVGYIRVRQITQDTADNVSAALADLIDRVAISRKRSTWRTSLSRQASSSRCRLPRAPPRSRLPERRLPTCPSSCSRMAIPQALPRCSPLRFRIISAPPLSVRPRSARALCRLSTNCPLAGRFATPPATTKARSDTTSMVSV